MANFPRKQGLFILLFFFYSVSNFAQMTLEDALLKARENAPALASKQLLVAERDLKLKNLNTASRPNLSLLAQATYQSEVTTLDIPLPNLEIDPLSKDQYKIQAELSQNIYDGGLAGQQKNLEKTGSDLALIGVELELEKLRTQVIPVYFAVLEADARIDILAIKKEDLLARQKVIQAAVENGTVLKLEAQSLAAALILLRQQETELQSLRKAQLEVLSLFIGTDLPANTILQIPPSLETYSEASTQSIRHQMFALQQQRLDQKDDLSLAANRPKIGAFLQGGYGKPGLNFLKNEFRPYYIAGARVQWNIKGLYTRSNDREIQSLGKQKIAIQQQDYDLQVSIRAAQYLAEIEKLKTLIASDEELLTLYEKIKNTARVQFDNGVLTAADYLQRLNEENRTRQSKSLHQIQLLRSQYLLQQVTSNYSK